MTSPSSITRAAVTLHLLSVVLFNCLLRIGITICLVLTLNREMPAVFQQPCVVKNEASERQTLQYASLEESCNWPEEYDISPSVLLLYNQCKKPHKNQLEEQYEA